MLSRWFPTPRLPPVPCIGCDHGVSLALASCLAAAFAVVALLIVRLVLLAALHRRRAQRAETLLLDAVSSSTQGFAIYDGDDRLILCNDGYRRICGDAAALLVPGMRFESLLRDGLAKGRYLDARGQEAAWLAGRLRHRRSGRGAITQRMSDGTCLLIDEQRMANGGIACGTIDITPVTGAQAALRESEQRFRDFAELASDWFWEQDAALRFTMIGPGCPPLRPGGNPYIGRRRWEVEGTTVPPERWESHRRDLAGRRPFRDFRYDQVGADGRMRHFSVSGVPMHDAAGRFTGYRGTGRDITDEVEAAADLRRAKERAEQVERLLRDAVDSISEGFVLYDADDRLVMCNDAYRRLYRRSAAMLVPGTRFEDILRHGLAHGEYPSAQGRESDWLAERLRRHRAAEGTVELQLGDGAWVIVSDRRTSDGGIAGLRTDITALKAAQAALRESEQRLDRAQEIAGMGSWEYHFASRRLVWSRQMYRLRGLSEAAFDPTAETVNVFVHPEDRGKHRAWFGRLAAGGRHEPVEYRILRHDGTVRTVVAEGRPVVDAAGTIVKLAGTLRDVTELRRTEAQLAQAQKMETIGQLTGGLAHDFNNILGAVVGNLDLVEAGVAPGSEAAGYCQEALHAALSGAELVRRLLAFARRQTLRPAPTDIAQALDDVLPLATRTLGERIVIESHVSGGLWPALADAVQLESAVLNLVVNARDAMPDGGILTIEAANAAVDAALVTAGGRLDPGEYVLITVADTGTGMTADVLAKAFEPFFTTKESGAGTGLGLSMVFGTMQQLGGAVHIESEAGQGTTVRLYLPRARDGAEAAERPAGPAERAPRGRAHILLVEDDPQLRVLGTGILRGLGYAVTTAENADAAMAHIEHGACFDLLFSDIMMPGQRNGIALAHAVRRRHPETRVLFTSGFSSPVTLREEIDLIDADLIPKPYRKAELARAVRAILDRAPEAVA